MSEMPPPADGKSPQLHESERALPRWTKVLIGAGVVSLVGGLALSLLQGELGWIESHRADSFSRSAIGHAAWVELLRSTGRQVIQSRHATETRLEPGDVLVVAEPVANDLEVLLEDEERAGEIEAALLEAPVPLLLVLPRREVTRADRQRAVWVDERPTSSGTRLLQALGVGQTPDLVRIDPPEWTINSLGLVPDLRQPQLIQGSDLEPLIAADGGILIGRTRAGPPRLVLADPDLIATHGIGRGDNAALSVSLIELLGDGKVWVDEVAHGHGAAPSAWVELFRPPLLWITLHALVGTLLLGWGAAIRFGSPRPPQPAFASGKAALLDNVGELMEAGGHAGRSARRYVEDSLAGLAASLHAPRGLAGGALHAWLSDRLRDPALREQLENLRGDARSRLERDDAARALTLARDAHAFCAAAAEASSRSRTQAAAPTLSS
jgi:hypothetical protein